MDRIYSLLIASAKRLGVDTDSKTFLDALEVSEMAYTDGRGIEASFELGRRLLVAGSVSSRACAVLTAA